MKTCAYCGQLIEGEARPVGDDAASAAHPSVFWHDDPTECGPRVPPLPGPDATSPYAPVTDSMRTWYARLPRP